MYAGYMSTTITVRIDDSLRRELEDRAASSGKSFSEVVREILENALAARPVDERAGHLRGKLELDRTDSDPWRERLRERNRRS